MYGAPGRPARRTRDEHLVGAPPFATQAWVVYGRGPEPRGVIELVLLRSAHWLAERRPGLLGVSGPALNVLLSLRMGHQRAIPPDELTDLSLPSRAFPCVEELAV